MTQKVTLTLSCGHSSLFNPPAPEAGEEVLCSKCNDYKFVITDMNKMIRIKCDDCPVGRKFGADKDEAERSASRHAMRYPTHTVSVLRGDSLLHKVGVKGETLPFEVQVSERAAFTREHQGSLRRMRTVTKPLP